MRKDLTNEQGLLADLMSDISERCYCAGWIGNLEFVLWDTLISGPRKYGHDFITQNEIDSLRLYLKSASRRFVILKFILLGKIRLYCLLPPVFL